MRLSESIAMLDTCAKFFRAVHISGWIKHNTETLLRIDLLNCNHIAHTFEVSLPDNVSSDIGGVDLGFSVDVMLKDDQFPFGAFIVFSFSNLKQQTVALYDLVQERLASAPTSALYHRFLKQVATREYRRLLDLGGRNRSQIDRSKDFPENEVTVIDILPGSNVEIVCDAHILSEHLPHESFDAVHSISVFEHILMPWKVVLEMNSILRPGGLVYVQTHQAVGMHDLPCDFWRFSADAWPALFNVKTGFEILETALSQEMFLIPHFYRPDTRDAERAAGFETSVVVARKISKSLLTWNVLPQEVSDASYPTL